MKKISTSIPAAALIVTMVLCVCMIYSSSCAPQKQPDPLLEYVYADRIVSPKHKIVVFAVFKHENAAFRQQIVLENQVGNRRERRQLIGWVGENQVELPLCGFDESKNVFANDDVPLGLEFLGAIFDELHVLGIHFNAHDWIAAPRQHFKRDAAGAGK